MFHAAGCWRAVPIAALQTSDWGGSETGSESMSDDEVLGGPGGGEAAVPIGMLHQSGIEAGSAMWSARACIWALPIRRSSTMCPDAMYGAEKNRFVPASCAASWLHVLGAARKRLQSDLQSKVQSMRPVVPAGGCITARARTVLLNAGAVRSSC